MAVPLPLLCARGGTPGRAAVRRLQAGVQAVLTSTACNGRVEILMPLFGGVRATVPQMDVARL
jgi:hypothetical protein